MRVKEISLSERPREKMYLRGSSFLSNAELLAIILKTGSREKNAIRLAEEILSLDQTGIHYLSQISLEELTDIKGIGKVKATEILAAIELGKRISCSCIPFVDSIRCSKDAANMFMEDMRHLKKEYFKAALLDVKGKVIGIENISIGDLSSSMVNPRETFVGAVKRSAHSILIVHNHPSGIPEPSKQDIVVTKRLYEVGKIIGIELVDHIIIGDGKFTSMKELGYI